MKKKKNIRLKENALLPRWEIGRILNISSVFVEVHDYFSTPIWNVY